MTKRSYSYTAEEADRILTAVPLMTQEQLLQRWQLSKKWLR